MVGADGQLPLPWLGKPLQDALRTQRGHALLVHGAQGTGQYELSLCLAQAWLCEGEGAQMPCGTCASCHLVQARSHPDLLVLVPEALRESLGWGGADDGDDEKSSKAKPSKEIKVEAVRTAVSFAQSTSARGQGKVVVIHPAERMNAISANTLLKTLEEPPGVARFVLSCGAPDALLPTIRSRCQAVALGLPPADVASGWLAQHKVAQPEVMLAAAGGQPLEALAWVQDGIDAVSWTRFPKQVAGGEAAPVAGWPLPLLIEALQKLCHDAMCVASGAPPRYFPPAALPAGATLPALAAWSKALRDAQRHAEHPWNMPVMAESLVLQAAQALKSPLAAKPPSVHSAR
ncbi:DNA polymerase III subunit delta' [Piscinibacter gummiphilus]|uniref:DNA polymerase III subunit delta n=1 Tax=Piscinibacter gummiphilus TaxID=946333 RepID=A0ABZ0D6B7_9BURK|nr:DNA polymerase III subunit delta' [Piscinibacter gummiphilus]WOB10812.1 DNA polymerase III subunit delta' [Piscinibacter gummiphilus]